jgi:hypothetical protein
MHIKFRSGKPEGNRLLGRPRRGWDDDDDKVNLTTGYERGNWLHLAQDRD